MIEGKTAALFAAAANWARCARARPARRRHAYCAFGRNLGLAFQVHDDILGIWGDSAVTGKSPATDIETRKKSLPVVYGLERSEPLRRAYASPKNEGGGTVAEITAVLEETGARKFAEQEARRLSRAALDHLESASPVPEAGQALHELTLDLLSRSH